MQIISREIRSFAAVHNAFKACFAVKLHLESRWCTFGRLFLHPVMCVYICLRIDVLPDVIRWWSFRRRIILFRHSFRSYCLHRCFKFVSNKMFSILYNDNGNIIIIKFSEFKYYIIFSHIFWLSIHLIYRLTFMIDTGISNLYIYPTWLKRRKKLLIYQKNILVIILLNLRRLYLNLVTLNGIF